MSATCQANSQSRDGADGNAGAREAWVPVPEPSIALEATIDLLARVQTGDQSAWDVLLNRYLRPLKQIGHNRLPGYARSMTDTDDVVQDALVKTIKRLRHFDCRNRGALLAYLRRSVLNRIVDETRKYARRVAVPFAPDDCPDRMPSPLEHVLGKEEVERYRAALGRLKPRDRQLIVLRVQQRLSYGDLAKRLGMASADAARIASKRAVWRFAAALKHV